MTPFQTIVLLFSIIDFGTTLPVTSKPIENTPEHLAWEAWIMIPPTQNKTRKITPKSIFILPNKTTTPPAIICPPGYVVENSKCIQTVQIDPGSILLNHLISTFNHTYEDYDYDYEEPNQLTAETSNPVPDYNDGPLKIDLLRPGTIRDYGLSAENDELNPKPFRGEESSSTTTTTTVATTTTENSQSNRLPEFGIESSTARSTAEDSIVTVTPKAVVATTSTTTTAPITTTEESISPQPSWSWPATTTTAPTTTTSTTTGRVPTTLLVEDLPGTVKLSSDSTPGYTTLPPSPSTTLTSSTASTDTFIFPDEELVSDEDYGMLEEEQTKPTNIGEDYSVEGVTSPDYTFTGTEEGFDEEEQSLPVRATHQTLTEVKPNRGSVASIDTDVAENSTAAEEEKSSTEPLTRPSFGEPSQPLLSTKSEPTLFPPFSTQPTFFQTNSEFVKPTFNTFINQNFASHPTIQIHDDPDPILDSIDNSNRFVYHHLDSLPASSKPQRSDSFTANHDVQEQIQMINKIVEENKKRANGGSKIRFPSDTFIQTDNLRADLVRFPEPTVSHHQMTAPTMPTRLFATDSKVIPILRQPTRLTPTGSFNPAHPQPPTAVTHPARQEPKPFWWLPSGWEVDRNGDKPLLLRFWSRASPASSSSSSASAANSSATSPTTMTTGARENSRRPTDNLYREISAQEFYKVLGTQNHHRHHNTNDFT